LGSLLYRIVRFASCAGGCLIRIIHISDLHFGKTKTRTQKAQRLLKNVLKIFPPDKNTYYMITGDTIDNLCLTTNAWKKQYKVAADALSNFKKNLIIVPGNHDYGFGGFGYSKKCSDYFDECFMPTVGATHKYRTKRPWHRILKDEEGNQVSVVGLNSCLMTDSPLGIAKGEVGEKQRAALDMILSDPEYKGVPKIVYLHHIPHRRAKGIGMSLSDYKKLMALVKGRIKAFAFGHEGSMKDPEARKAKIAPLLTPPMMIRYGPAHKIKYYLDANASVDNQACYCIEATGRDIVARFVKCRKLVREGVGMTKPLGTKTKGKAEKKTSRRKSGGVSVPGRI